MFIDYKDFNNLEAAHLLARAAGGGSHPSNGMALERNLHWAFDKGFFTVNFNGKEYFVEVHKDAMRIPYLSKMHEKKLWVPEDSRSRPNVESLKWHKENVFGLFLKTEI
jgi:predicted restriction endonuclease